MSRDFRILGFEELKPEDACEFLAQAGAHLKRLYKRIAELEARAEKAEALLQEIDYWGRTFKAEYPFDLLREVCAALKEQANG